MPALLLLPFIIQGVLISWDEFFFHQKRNLPRWERVGHPLDTLSMIACVAIAVFATWSQAALITFTAFALFSCLFVTKDEWVHTKYCTAAENWLHAMLFILHPLVLISVGVLWANGFTSVLWVQFMVLCGFAVYQTVYWNWIRPMDHRVPIPSVNNECYQELGNRWYEADDDPVALLRAESRLRTPWVLEQVESHFRKNCKILDVACGAGFLSNPLAAAGHQVTGIDVSSESLAVARRYDTTQSVQYVEMNAAHLEFADSSFDVVCAMDFLEHVEHPETMIKEMARVLRPGGLFFFHTFDRSILSYLLVIKGVEWFVKNTPPHLHLYRLMIKPKELRHYSLKAGLKVIELHGSRPRINRAFFQMLWSGKISPQFEFTRSRSLHAGYTGFALKAPPF